MQIHRFAAWSARGILYLACLLSKQLDAGQDYGENRDVPRFMLANCELVCVLPLAPTLQRGSRSKRARLASLSAPPKRRNGAVSPRQAQFRPLPGARRQCQPPIQAEIFRFSVAGRRKAVSVGAIEIAPTTRRECPVRLGRLAETYREKSAGILACRVRVSRGG
jgi:hypothetical protein